MKRSTILLPLGLLQSENTGAAKTYRFPAELRKAVGQADEIRYQFVGFRRSTNARVVLELYESPYEDLPADEVYDGTPFHTSANCDALRSAPASISGPFSTNVEILIKCSDSTATGPEEWYGLVAATLIYKN